MNFFSLSIRIEVDAFLHFSTMTKDLSTSRAQKGPAIINEYWIAATAEIFV